MEDYQLEVLTALSHCIHMCIKRDGFEGAKVWPESWVNCWGFSPELFVRWARESSLNEVKEGLLCLEDSDIGLAACYVYLEGDFNPDHCDEDYFPDPRSRCMAHAIHEGRLTTWDQFV